MQRHCREKLRIRKTAAGTVRPQSPRETFETLEPLETFETLETLNSLKKTGHRRNLYCPTGRNRRVTRPPSYHPDRG